MPLYIINKNAQTNGDHEVHNNDSTKGCLPNVENRIGLGVFSSCGPAVREAKRRWPREKINGCYYCANACHTS